MRGKVERSGMGPVEFCNGALVCAQAALTFGAGRTDVIGIAGQFDTGVPAIRRAQAIIDNGAHVGGKGVRISLALKSERAEKMVWPKPERGILGHLSPVSNAGGYPDRRRHIYPADRQRKYHWSARRLRLRPGAV